MISNAMSILGENHKQVDLEYFSLLEESLTNQPNK